MSRKSACWVLLLGMLAGSFVWAGPGTVPKTIRRARPPEFDEQDVAGIFFRDVFSEALSGERPANFGQPPSAAPSSSGGTPSVAQPSGGGLYPWKSVISATAIEDEVKAIKIDLDKEITSPNAFASGGFKKARRQFSMVAMLFAIVGEYDGDVRWKGDAPKIRDAFAHSARNCKVGSIQAFNEAKQRLLDLQDIISGGSFAGSSAAEPKANWGALVDRGPLMQRLEIAQQSRLQPAVGNENEFRANKETIVHEANIVAAIAEVLIQQGMPEAEEEDYAMHAKNMKQAAHELIDAVKLDSYESAAKAVGAIGQACSKCHENWR